MEVDAGPGMAMDFEEFGSDRTPRTNAQPKKTKKLGSFENEFTSPDYVDKDAAPCSPGPSKSAEHIRSLFSYDVEVASSL